MLNSPQHTVAVTPIRSRSQGHARAGRFASVPDDVMFSSPLSLVSRSSSYLDDQSGESSMCMTPPSSSSGTLHPRRPARSPVSSSLLFTPPSDSDRGTPARPPAPNRPVKHKPRSHLAVPGRSESGDTIMADAVLSPQVLRDPLPESSFVLHPWRLIHKSDHSTKHASLDVTPRLVPMPIQARSLRVIGSSVAAAAASAASAASTSTGRSAGRPIGPPSWSPARALIDLQTLCDVFIQRGGASAKFVETIKTVAAALRVPVELLRLPKIRSVSPTPAPGSGKQPKSKRITWHLQASGWVDKSSSPPCSVGLEYSSHPSHSSSSS